MRLVAITIAVIMLAAALIYRFVPHSVDTAQSEADRALTTTTNSFSLDTDSDGIPDWEEQLFGTDPKDASSVPTSADMTIESDASSSATTKLAHTLLNQYLSSTKGGTTELKDITSLSAALANSVSVATPVYHTYSTSDLKTVKSSPDSRNRYQKDMQNIFTTMNQVSTPEIGLYRDALSGDTAAEAQLGAIADIYTSTASAAAHISVPTEATLTHINILNALGYYGATLQGLITHKEDPIGSLVLLRAYNEAEQRMFTSFNALRSYIATFTTAS
jgi:hypothetical protein